MLKKAGGFDQRYFYHHLYDRDASLESLRHGYKNIVVDIPCHHMSGLTANRSEYQNWVKDQLKDKLGKDDSGDKYTHDKNTILFQEKWKGALPLYIEDDFSFRHTITQIPGTTTFYEFTGGAITKHEEGQTA